MSNSMGYSLARAQAEKVDDEHLDNAIKWMDADIEAVEEHLNRQRGVLKTLQIKRSAYQDERQSRVRS